MKLHVIRFSDSGDSTNGLLMVDGKFFGYTLEDEKRDHKVHSETRIPEGIYQIGWQNKTTPMTLDYRIKYDWFDKFLHVKDVPNFKGIYIHVGNTDEDTAGCLLVGDKQFSNTNREGLIQNSLSAVKRLYTLVGKELELGNEVTIKYSDMEDEQQVIRKSGGTIMEYLRIKENKAFKNNPDKFEAYPVTVSTDDLGYKTLYIQDAKRSVSSDLLNHTLELILYDKEDGKIYVMKKYCKAACPVDWDTVTCAFELSI